MSCLSASLGINKHFEKGIIVSVPGMFKYVVAKRQEGEGIWMKYLQGLWTGVKRNSCSIL